MHLAFYFAYKKSFSSNAPLAALDASLETPVVPEHQFREFRENNDMIKDILLSSMEEILEENYQSYRKKRMFFRYPVQTTLTSYILNSVTVTNTFTPNGVDCPPPGYMTISSADLKDYKIILSSKNVRNI